MACSVLGGRTGWRWLGWGLALALASAAPLRADQVKLADGGTLEGRVRRERDQVIVELDSGEIRLAAKEVVEVTAARSALHECDERRQALAPHDVRGAQELAVFCEAHGVSSKARALWQQVLRLDPDNAQARRALGFVREGEGWITRDERARRDGKVRYQGQWIEARAMAEIEQARAAATIADAERKKAEQEREKAELELRAAREKAEAERIEREADAKRAKQEAENAPYLNYGGWYGYGYPGWGRPRPCVRRPGVPCAPTAPPPRPRADPLRPDYGPFPIPGVKDPRSY